MLVSVFLALFLPCAGMSTVFLVYVILLWYSSGQAEPQPQAEHTPDPKPAIGLSIEELAKIPVVTGKELMMGNDCAVCLDDIESEQPARLIPGCNHGFHLQCADAWLSKNRICPLCRNKLGSDLFEPPEANPC